MIMSPDCEDARATQDDDKEHRGRRENRNAEVAPYRLKNEEEEEEEE